MEKSASEAEVCLDTHMLRHGEALPNSSLQRCVIRKKSQALTGIMEVVTSLAISF